MTKDGQKYKKGSNVAMCKQGSVYLIQIYDLVGFWVTTGKVCRSLKEAREVVKVLRSVLD